MKKVICLMAGMIFLPACIIAQPPSIKSVIDKNSILIGQPINLKVSATYNPVQYKVTWLNMPDSLAHFELVDRLKTDTTTANGATTLEQIIVVTSFDSGVWKMPSLDLRFEPLRNSAPVQLFTDSFRVNVAYVNDTSSVLKDIKPIWEVTTMDPIWYYVIGGIIALIVIIGGILFYRYMNKKKPVDVFASKQSAYTEAMQEMEKLKTLDLNNIADVKMYHTRLSEITRRYLSRKQRLNLMNKTTGDLLMLLKDQHIQQEQTTKAASALRIGDAVKFAKYAPPVYESEQVFADIKQLITAIEKAAAPVAADENK